MPQELLFVFGLGWGVVGAALAPAIGQYVGLAVMVGLLIREKALFAADLRHIPTLAEVAPLLKVRAQCTARALGWGCLLLLSAQGLLCFSTHSLQAAHQQAHGQSHMLGVPMVTWKDLPL